MQLLTFVLCLALVASPDNSGGSYGGGSTPPCLADGDCVTICESRPPLGQEGDPADAEWVGGTGNPRGVEDDPVYDDDLGAAYGEDPACIEICNVGGNLQGPNGDDQNEGSEGDEIEVKVCWTYRYRVTVTVETSTSTSTSNPLPGGSKVGSQTTHSKSTTMTVWKFGKKCSTTTVVKAC